MKSNDYYSSTNVNLERINPNIDLAMGLQTYGASIQKYANYRDNHPDQIGASLIYIYLI